MGPKKKNQIKNAFYFYMLHYKEQAEKRGEYFPHGLRDVAGAASTSWQAMSESEKAPYIEKAKHYKAQVRGDPEVKYTTTGISFAEVDRRLREEEERQAAEMRFIENEVHNLTSREALANKLFYLIHVNWYCVVSHRIYIPAEISLVEFSLKTGISRQYHKIINPGPPPTGYRLAAQEHAESTHQIPLEYEKGDSNFYMILRDIIDFIKVGGSGDELPAMYTMSDCVNYNTSISAVKSTLQTLSESENSDVVPEFRVYLIDKLFYELRNECAKYSDDKRGFPTIAIPLMELEKEVFSFAHDICCNFHHEIDRSLYCSLSKVKGWTFLICDHCCQDLEIDLIPGKHCPSLVDPRLLKSKPRTKSPSPPPNEKEKLCSGKKKEIDGNAWVERKREDSEGAWGPPSQAKPSRPGTLAAIVSSDYEPPDFTDVNFPAIRPSQSTSSAQSISSFDFSEDSFPAMARGRGRGHRTGRRNVGKIVPDMRSLNLH